MNDLNPQNTDSAEDSSFVIDFPGIYHMIREKAWLVALTVVVGGLFAGAYIMQTPKIYEASTVVEVEQGQRKVVNIQDIKIDDLSSLEVLKTIEQNLSSSALLSGVLQAL